MFVLKQKSLALKKENTYNKEILKFHVIDEFHSMQYTSFVFSIDSYQIRISSENTVESHATVSNSWAEPHALQRIMEQKWYRSHWGENLFIGSRSCRFHSLSRKLAKFEVVAAQSAWVPEAQPWTKMFLSTHEEHRAWTRNQPRLV